ncbi:MAG: hypothetical protein WCP97_04025 [bacterium]
MRERVLDQPPRTRAIDKPQQRLEKHPVLNLIATTVAVQAVIVFELSSMLLAPIMDFGVTHSVIAEEERNDPNHGHRAFYHVGIRDSIRLSSQRIAYQLNELRKTWTPLGKNRYLTDNNATVFMNAKTFYVTNRGIDRDQMTKNNGTTLAYSTESVQGQDDSNPFATAFKKMFGS